jgi:vacuolar protein sorting-associated protein 13A/C
MASTVLNFIVENYLSNFIEINPSQTKASLWSGEVQMSNVKIKKELFQTMNIPFFEVVHGYIGSIKIIMSMPMFYKYPIKVQIENVFFHARQKDINEIIKEEEIKNMEAYKLSTLDNQEILKSQLNQIDKEESSSMQKQIINNLHITIKNVVFRYDDNVSYKKIPYSLGLILEHLSLRSTKSDFQIPSNPDEIIQCEEESYKVISMKNLSFFWDCFSDNNELRFNNLIENSYYNSIKSEIKQYLGPQLDFFVYCLSEIGVHSRNKRAHQYILHNINMELKATINENINKNLRPEYIGDLEFPSVVIDFSLKQIETILKVLSYMNLSSLYHEGLAKEFYKKELSEEEKQKYIKEYVIYFHQKYDLQQNITFPESLTKMQEGLSLFQIQLMRAASLKKSGFFKEKAELEKKIKEQEGKFFF